MTTTLTPPTIQESVTFDGIDSDEDEPVHISNPGTKPLRALCGRNLEGEAELPELEVPDEALCPVCRKIEGWIHLTRGV